ncbi:hypothetical protein ACNYDF_00340 [Klebsiella aerogenes]|uniref:hypothetical protein n=1 Tax=Klebsiella aerogenes TaxID=548 RepID=UPI0037A6B456
MTLEREFHQYKINRSEIQTTGWEQFQHFDVHDTKNPNRKQIRLKVKQAIKRIDCYDIDGRHGHFEVTFADETKQRIVIKFNRNRSPGVSYVEAQTVNDHDLLKMQGLVLHSFIDELISPDKFAQHIKEKHEASLLNPTYITELENSTSRDKGNGMAIIVDGSTSKTYATVNGTKYEINSLEDLEKLSH